MDVIDPDVGGTADAVEQIRKSVRYAAATAEAIGPVLRELHSNPDIGLDNGA